MREIAGFGTILDPSPDARPQGLFAQRVAPANCLVAAHAQGLLSPIKPDNRERRVDTHCPWLNMICQIETSIDNKVAMRGTGFIVGLKDQRHVLLTAAHVLCQHDAYNSDLFADSARIRPGRNGDSAPYGIYDVTADDWMIHPHWWPDQPVAYDIAIIRLRTRIQPDGSVPGATQPGCFGIGALVDEALKARIINVAGYPAVVGDQTADCEHLYWHKDAIAAVEDDRLLHVVDTSEGQSGAPAVLMPADGHSFTGPLVVGLHTRGINVQGQNAATRITQDILSWIYNFIGG